MLFLIFVVVIFVGGFVDFIVFEEEYLGVVFVCVDFGW